MRWSIRAAIVALLAAAGSLWVIAAAERWRPACKRGDFDADACIKLQDHLYDYVAPVAPWVPVGDAAQVAGTALALLALGLALLPWLWVPRRPLVCLMVAVPALAVLLIGVVTVSSGLSGEAAPDSWVVPISYLVWTFGLPVALIVVVSTSRDADNAPQRTMLWRFAVVCLITVSTPLVEAFLTPLVFGYVSHDSTPWVEAMTGAFLVSAGIASWPATRAPRPAAEASSVPVEA